MLGVVAAAFDEADVLPSFVARLTAVLETTGDEWEVVLVDDGSRDGTWSAIEAAAAPIRAFAASGSRATSGTSLRSPRASPSCGATA